ncbi:MAG TPA: DUF2723 domain-containing protein [bacterium]|nr:DUF2723 domain-containing protein [bacterium]HQL63561.1 DUF2723 domain-containing protein [bacterium]
MPSTSNVHVHHSSPKDSVAIFLCVFAFYLITLHPALPWGDAPELITACATLGVPHPPGYPLYVVLGKLLSIVPFGTVMMRIHILSALCASCALVFLYRAAETLAMNHGPMELISRISCVLWLGTAPVFWGIARSAEVYALLALFLSVALYLSLCAKQPGKDFSGFAWLLAGVSLVHHYIVLPVLVWMLWQVRKRFFLLIILPLLLLLIPMIRSRAGVELDWYHPASFQGWMALLTGGEFVGNLSRGLFRFLNSPLQAFFLDLCALFWPWGIFLPLLFVGVWRLYRREKRCTVIYLSILCIYAAFFLFYLVGDRDVFVLPFLLVSAPLVCLGLEWCIGKLHLMERGVILLCLLLLLLPVVRAYWRVALVRDDTEAFRYSEDVLRILPPNALLLVGLYEPSQDNEIFPLIYQQTVEHRRPDVDPIGNGFLALPWYREKLAGKGIGIRLKPLPLGKYRTPTEWYEDVWSGIILTSKDKRPICSTIPPAYVAQWRGVSLWKDCGAQLLLEQRSFTDSYYGEYLPWGTVFLLHPDMTPNKSNSIKESIGNG